MSEQRIVDALYIRLRPAARIFQIGGASFDAERNRLAKVHALQGQVDQAAAILHQLLQQHPDHALAKKLLEQLRR